MEWNGNRRHNILYGLSMENTRRLKEKDEKTERIKQESKRTK